MIEHDLEVVIGLVVNVAEFNVKSFLAVKNEREKKYSGETVYGMKQREAESEKNDTARSSTWPKVEGETINWRSGVTYFGQEFRRRAVLVEPGHHLNLRHAMVTVRVPLLADCLQHHVHT